MSSRSPGLAVRRSVQTLRHFRNGASILTALASPGRELVFDVRDGPTIHCPNRPGARVPVYEIFAEDAYRLESLLQGLDAPVVLDIGAHIGCFSVAVARARPAALVHSYEASPATAGWLTRNVVANGVDRQVVVHQKAVGDHDGNIEFMDNAAGSSLNGMTAPTGTSTSVPCVTLASAFAAAGGSVDLVKIDTEGAEYAMVLASPPSVWDPVHRVVLEYHDVPGHSWDELDRFFLAAGFAVRDIAPSGERQGTVWLERRA